MTRFQRYSCVCAMLMPALSGMGCDNDYTEVVLHCPPEADCVWTCEEGECRLEHSERRGAAPGGPAASAEPDVAEPEPQPEAPEPDAPAPQPETPEPEAAPEPEAPEPEAPEPAPEPEHTAPDACMILCADLDKDAAVCLHEGLSELHAECDQVIECETLTEPADCQACLSALHIEPAACEAFGAICR